MTLDINKLTSGLKNLFEAPPASFSGCADQWAAAVYDYSMLVVPISTTAAVARDVLAASLTASFTASVDVTTTANSMENAFTAYATTLAAGMLPAYAGVAPTGGVGFADIFSAAPSAVVDLAVAAFTTKIDLWFKLGTATLIAPPNTVVGWT
jgi:hypothetical protein